MNKFKDVILILAAGVLLAVGCRGGEVTHSSSPEVRAFFVAGQQARLLGMRDTLSRESIDLSAYAHLMEVRYPPTTKVDVLKGPPAQSFVLFATLKGPKPPGAACDDPAVIQGFTAKARDIGADAIIICSPGASDSSLEVLAIKYKRE
jgi:hypothetical protein